MSWTSVGCYLKSHHGLTDLLSALVGGKDESGKSIFSGRKVTGFSNAEEDMAGWTQVNRIYSDSRIYLPFHEVCSVFVGR